jgi:hypothetical protein
VPFLALRLGAPSLSFWVMGAASSAVALAVMLLPETKGRPQADSLEQLEALYSSPPAAGPRGGPAYKPLAVADDDRGGGGGGCGGWGARASGEDDEEAPDAPRAQGDQDAGCAPPAAHGPRASKVWGSFTSEWSDAGPDPAAWGDGVIGGRIGSGAGAGGAAGAMTAAERPPLPRPRPPLAASAGRGSPPAPAPPLLATSAAEGAAPRGLDAWVELGALAPLGPSQPPHHASS